MLRSFIFPALALAAAALAAPAAAQVTSTFARELPPPERILVEFASGVGSDDDYGLLAIEWVRRHPDAVSPARMNALLQGIEELAVRDTSADVRSAAIGELAAFGSLRTPHPHPGIYARLRRVYRDAPDAEVRLLVIGALADASERQPAAEFLALLAAQHGAGADFEGAPDAAVFSLSVMGDEGSRALRRLHERNLVRDPRARARLEQLAAQGFTYRDAESP